MAGKRLLVWKREQKRQGTLYHCKKNIKDKTTQGNRTRGKERAVQVFIASFKFQRNIIIGEGTFTSCVGKGISGTETKLMARKQNYMTRQLCGKETRPVAKKHNQQQGNRIRRK